MVHVCEEPVVEECPAVNFDFVNTGVNMTLFAPNGAEVVLVL